MTLLATLGGRVVARFSSIEHSPAATRGILRDRLARYLTSEISSSQAGRRVHHDVTLSDELMLRLLLNLRIDFASDLDSARTTYNSNLSATSNEPSIEELIDTGWLTVVWGRISAPFDLVRAAEAATPMSALCSLLKSRFEETCQVTIQPGSHPELDDVTARITNKELRPEQVGCQSPDWVAARLWDRIRSDSDSQTTALRVWFDRWEKLGHPSFVPHVVWDEDAVTMFREATFAVLESDSGICGWDEARNELIKKYALVNNETVDTIASRIPIVPKSLVDRVAWVFDVFGVNRMREHGDISWLVSLILSVVEADNNGPAPNPVAKRLIGLAIESADLFFILVLQLSGRTQLLADLLLHPATTAVACLLIAKRTQNSGAWDRDLIDRDNKTTKSMAFADAVSMLGHFLAQGDTSPNEAASLMEWFHENVPYSVPDQMETGESLLTTLRNELSQQSREVLRAMVDALFTSSDSELETAKFGAAVDIVDCGDLSDEVDPMPFVDAYSSLVGSASPVRRSVRLSATAAATLARIALRAPHTSSWRFFYPIDTVGALAECSEEDRYSIVFELGRSIRTHIRTLSGAISAFSGSVPEEIKSALVTAIRTGALAHHENGRISAFSPDYEEYGADGNLGRSIAADIGSAIDVLSANDKDRVLSAVLETDEPMLLAQLLQFAPHNTRERTIRRIEELTPSEAGEVYSLTHVQARIETLLSAGLADAAERFIGLERELSTLGPIPGRVVARLRTTLRLHLLREEWDEIANAEIPEDLTTAEQRSADEAISFYKGLALLNDPSGERVVAERLFSRLHRERPDVFAYFVNLFATRLSILLEDDPFTRLNSIQRLRGHQLLSDTERELHQYGAISIDESEIYTCNRAQLLISVGQPQQALDHLASINPTTLRDVAAACSAVALARLNRSSEAQAVLEQATLQVGETDVLRTARDLVRSTPYAGVVIALPGDDAISRVKNSLFDLKQMDHVEQAKVLHPSGSADEHVISHVRAAAASITELVPMMRSVGIAREDDLNAFLKELLTQRFEFLGWSVGDEMRGGYTERGNPGERDIVLRLGATTVTVLEAVICRSGAADRTKIKRHFARLMAYGTCDVFFLVVYSYVDRPNQIVQIMEEISRDEPPNGFAYRRRHDIDHEDSRPPGFIAYYGGEWGEVRVVFLTLDIRQSAQRSAVRRGA